VFLSFFSAKVWNLNSSDLVDDDIELINDDDLLDEDDKKKPDPASLRGDMFCHIGCFNDCRFQNLYEPKDTKSNLFQTWSFTLSICVCINNVFGVHCMLFLFHIQYLFCVLDIANCGEGPQKRKACKNCTCGLAEELEVEASKNKPPVNKSACGNVSNISVQPTFVCFIFVVVYINVYFLLLFVLSLEPKFRNLLSDMSVMILVQDSFEHATHYLLDIFP
jgi:hypothetical protein